MTDQTLAEPDEDVSDLEALSLTREESRAVLDRKLKALDEIDAKAMHTGRTAVVILGLVISALALLQRGGPTQFGIAPELVAGAGTLCLLLAIVTGVVTYTASGVPAGISQSYREDVRDGGFDEVDWLLVLLGGYDQWVEGVDRAIQRKERHLLRTVIARGGPRSRRISRRFICDNELVEVENSKITENGTRTRTRMEFQRGEVAQGTDSRPRRGVQETVAGQRRGVAPIWRFPAC
jgi:hypothetical protein